MYFVGREAHMADFTSFPQGGGYDTVALQYGAANERPNALTTLTNMAGAFISLALIAGIAVWGYDLVMRDVSGVPVVRAAAGEMRVRPEEPGGELAQHQGLSVNTVAAEGVTGEMTDTLLLAPEQGDLNDEDQPITPQMVASWPQAQADETAVAPVVRAPIQDVAAAIQSGNVDDLVAQLTEGVAPLEAVTPAQNEPVDAAVAEAVVEALVNVEPLPSAVVLDAPGVRQSLRPQRRPELRAVVTNASLVSSTSLTGIDEIDPASVPVGTRLVQLGAFDSAEIARDQWGKLDGRFGEYLRDKKRVVQKATSGGRVFYRLRAVGFEDLGDARRFCSTLVAGKAECIPVVSR